MTARASGIYIGRKLEQKIRREGALRRVSRLLETGKLWRHADPEAICSRDRDASLYPLTLCYMCIQCQVILKRLLHEFLRSDYRAIGRDHSKNDKLYAGYRI